MIEYCDVDLRKWDVLSTVDDEKLQNLELVHVFGFDASSAFFITANDEVFAIGNNVLNRLGIGQTTEDEITVPEQIKPLSGKQVICFSTSSNHCLALTKAGVVYAWGGNAYGQIGNGTLETQATPCRIDFLEGEEIKEISCADRYSLALSVQNKLYHWGDAAWDFSIYVKTPSLLKLPSDLTITAICCGAHHAAAVTDKGKLITWGVNDFGQLGTSSSNEVEILELPQFVRGQLADQYIVKVTCSYRATLALTREGQLYAWGYNKNGALSVGDMAEVVHQPQRVIFLNNIVNIASNNLLHILCAETRDPHHIHVWAYDDNPASDGVTYPTILDVFSGQPMPRVLRKSLSSHNPSSQGPVRDVGKALFNNKEYSDLTIKLADGEVYVHTLMMRTFSEHFKTLLDDNWSNGKKVINMSEYNPKAYRAFLKYVYTGILDQLEGTEIIALCDLAVSYFENELKNLCIKMFNHCLTETNVVQLYTLAVGNHSELVDSCIQFTSQRLEPVILSEGFELLEPFLSKNLIISAVKFKCNKFK